MSPVYPATGSAQDQAAALRWDAVIHRWWIEPAATGRYPAGPLPADRLAAMLDIRPGDETELAAGRDFVGVNYYTPTVVRHDPARNGPLEVEVDAKWGAPPPGAAADATAWGWAIHPRGLRDVLNRVHQVAGAPIEVLENGAAYPDGPGADGRVRDVRRIAYLRAHLTEVAAAIGEGVPVGGYHCWSLLDNFEWQAGYSQRFGLVHVDYANGRKRTIKDSGRWYAAVARANALT